MLKEGSFIMKLRWWLGNGLGYGQNSMALSTPSDDKLFSWSRNFV
jgi:hypothetical protein